MSPTTDTGVMSPQRIGAKVLEGRVEKARTKKGEGVIPNYRIGGRTFACEGCKAGHRVSKCTHALQRPVLMTNDPGRPSADQKRHCDCPRQCSCTKKNCKCDRNCACTQKMYMLVYVPVANCETAKYKDIGEWKIDREVTTDLKGNTLSDEEIQYRAQQKALQQLGRSSRGSTIGLGTSTASSIDGITTSTTAIPAKSKSESLIDTEVRAPKPSCCSHRQKIQEETAPTMKLETVVTLRKDRENDVVPTQSKRVKCDCGSDCTCAFCLDHPNNATSQKIAQQRVAEFTWNTPGLQGSHSASNQFQTLEETNSCMGTSPQFAWHTSPNPSMMELQHIFGQENIPLQGYYLSYPFRTFKPGSSKDQSDECHQLVSPTPAPIGNPSNPATLGTIDSMEAVSSNNLSQTGMTSPLYPPSLSIYRTSQSLSQQQDDLRPYPLSSVNAEISTFSHDYFIGQATVAGVHGMGREWATSSNIDNIPIDDLDWFSGSTQQDPPCFETHPTAQPTSHHGAFPALGSGTISPMATQYREFRNAIVDLPTHLLTTNYDDMQHRQKPFSGQAAGPDIKYDIDINAFMAQSSVSSTTSHVFRDSMSSNMSYIPRDSISGTASSYFTHLPPQDQYLHSPNAFGPLKYPT